MGEIFAIVVARAIIREIGLFTRYFFFILIGKKRTIKSLSNETKDEYNDLGNAIKQDVLNAIVGAIIVVLLIIFYFLPQVELL